MSDPKEPEQPPPTKRTIRTEDTQAKQEKVMFEKKEARTDAKEEQQTAMGTTIIEREINPQNNDHYFKEFKKLETRLRKIAGLGDTTPFSEILRQAASKFFLIKEKESIIIQLQHLRNIIAHADGIKYITTVSNLAFEELEKIICLLENPPTVKEIFRTDVYKVNVDEIAENVILTMQEKTYTHVPVYKNGKFWGVFSESTLLEWLVENIVENIKEENAQFYKLQIKDIKREYLHSSFNKTEFIEANESIFEVQKKFDEAIKKRERLGALLITETGKRDELPIGIITAWDLPRIDEYIKKYS